jgi:hypothetical protein
MNDRQKSWQALGLLALALTVGAIRLGEDYEIDRSRGFSATPAAEPAVVRCDSRLDLAWFDDCLEPESRIAVR